ncbi:MAG TPA: hypothetical protein VJ987_04815 [Anaerolineales bacterium]|nr:hypothetical protein [Anaerolineales bacterium]
MKRRDAAPSGAWPDRARIPEDPTPPIPFPTREIYTVPGPVRTHALPHGIIGG